MAGSTNVGSIHYDLSLDTSKFDAASGRIKEKTSVLSDGLHSLGLVGATAVAAVGAAISAALVVNMDKAIKRVDILNNFPNVMKNLGYATDESSAAIKKLEAGVKGLPTSLSDIASAMQNIAPSTKSLEDATKLTLALNNALLAGGKPMEIQSTAMEQFSQAISKGKPDMVEWRSLAVAMPGQLDQIAQSLGYGRGQWQQMASDVGENILPFSKVTEAIVKLNEKGLGNFPSFADQAKNASGGLQTSMANMNTAIARGIAKVIMTIGTTKIVGAITAFGNFMEAGLKKAAEAIKIFSDYLDKNKWAVEALKGAAIGLAIAMFVGLAPALWSVVTAIGAMVLAAAPFVAIGAGIAYLQYRFDIFGKAVTAVRPIIQGIASVFHTLATGDFKGGMFGLTEDSPVVDALIRVHELLVSIWKFVVTQFISIWKQLNILIAPIIQFIVQHLDFFKNALIALVLVGLVPIVTAIAFVIAAITAAIVIINVIITAVNWLISVFTSIITTMINVGTAIYNVLAPPLMFIANVIRGFYQVWFTIWSAIFQITYTIISTIVQIVLVPLRALVGWIYSTILQPIFGAFVWAFNGIANAVRGPINSMVGFVSGMMNAARNNIINPIRDAFNQVNGLAGQFWNAGRNIINGIVNGISSGAGAVVGKIQEICRGALDSVKRFFGIKSPSKVMATQGNFIMQGLGVGLQQGTKNAINAAQQSMQLVSNQMQGSASLDTILSGARRSSSAALASQTLGGAGATVNTYIYGDTHINGETDQQAFFDRMAKNFETVSRGAAI